MKNLETWQPKKGELVWVLDHKPATNYFTPCIGQVIRSAEDDELWIGYKNKSGQLVCRYLKNITIEPYAKQDVPKIDFSVAGQWLKWGKTLFITNGVEDGDCFFGSYLGDGLRHSSKISKKLNWQLLAAEQMKPLLDAYKAFTESRSD
jgi:hypothetical protein